VEKIVEQTVNVAMIVNVHVVKKDKTKEIVKVVVKTKKNKVQ
jgi:hypothetical protein